jgi:hypothetical protein
VFYDYVNAQHAISGIVAIRPAHFPDYAHVPAIRFIAKSVGGLRVVLVEPLNNLVFGVPVRGSLELEHALPRSGKGREVGIRLRTAPLSKPEPEIHYQKAHDGYNGEHRRK